MLRKTIRRVGLSIAALLLVLLSGCAALESGSTPEEKVRQRAQTWADALLRGDIEAAWKLTSPSYREYATADVYQGQVGGAFRWTGADVSKVACEEDICEVTVMIAYEIKNLGVKNRRPLEYKWISAGNQWWLHVPIR